MKMRTGHNAQDEYWCRVPADQYYECVQWCFANLGQPNDIFTGNVGKWDVKAKRATFYFLHKQDFDNFVGAMK